MTVVEIGNSRFRRVDRVFTVRIGHVADGVDSTRRVICFRILQVAQVTDQSQLIVVEIGNSRFRRVDRVFTVQIGHFADGVDGAGCIIGFRFLQVVFMIAKHGFLVIIEVGNGILCRIDRIFAVRITDLAYRIDEQNDCLYGIIVVYCFFQRFSFFLRNESFLFFRQIIVRFFCRDDPFFTAGGIAHLADVADIGRDLSCFDHFRRNEYRIVVSLHPDLAVFPVTAITAEIGEILELFGRHRIAICIGVASVIRNEYLRAAFLLARQLSHVTTCSGDRSYVVRNADLASVR